jgi:pSer/pThr/pTyr-binding forkhead associated (FHA) protein
VIEAYGDVFRVRDLGSRNGTKLNDKKVATEILDNGDVILAGATELRFIDPQQNAPRKRRNSPRLRRHRRGEGAAAARRGDHRRRPLRSDRRRADRL